MAITIPGYTPSPPIPHLNNEGKPCGGIFRFAASSLDAVATHERTCSWCDRKEAYDPDRLILVGKCGISQESLQSYGIALAHTFEAIRAPAAGKKPIPFSAAPFVVEIAHDKSNGERFAAIIRGEHIGIPSDSERFLREVDLKFRETSKQSFPPFDEIVEWVWKKPIVYNCEGAVIPFRP